MKGYRRDSSRRHTKADAAFEESSGPLSLGAKEDVLLPNSEKQPAVTWA
jgi:hypothetical protein